MWSHQASEKRWGIVRNTRSTKALALFAIIGITIAGLSPAKAALRVPKTLWPACSVSPGTYCVDSVIVTDSRGRQIPLVWVPNGQAVPQATAASGPLMAPLAFVNSKSGQVQANAWWEQGTNRDVLLSGTATFVDGSSLVNTPNMPSPGAKLDPTTKTWDATEPIENWQWQQDCWNPATKSNMHATRADCFKGAVLVIQDNELKYLMQMPLAADAARQITWLKTGYFVDTKDLANQSLQPAQNSTYDAKAKTFSKTEALFYPKWILTNYLVEGWQVPGLGAMPTDAQTQAANTVDTTTAAAASANGSVDSSTAIDPNAIPNNTSAATSPIEQGRKFSGRWTSPSWNTLGLNALGYDGLMVEAKAANEFVNHSFVDVLPVMVDKSNNSFLAGQTGNKNYATNLDPDTTISVKLRTGDIKTGVTVAVGVDTEVQQGQDQYGNTLTITGNPVSVAIAKDSKDCTGESGVAVANVRQFQTLIVVQNDTAGFGVDGTSGNMYVGSNGVCNLSTPVWNADEKSFSWQTAAPHFASDGQTQNKGFYKAVIPFNDAALLWGLTNPADAATALTVSVQTEQGGSSAAISVVSAKNNNIVIDVSGFGFSRPKLSIKMKPGYKPSKKKISALPKAKTTITCVSGKTTKKITDVTPKCPSGYRKLV